MGICCACVNNNRKYDLDYNRTGSSTNWALLKRNHRVQSTSKLSSAVKDSSLEKVCTKGRECVCKDPPCGRFCQNKS